MDTTNATASVFAAFIEADKALKELPEVRDALAKAQAEAKDNADLYHMEADTRTQRERRITELEAKLAQTEAALADATKSRESAEHLLNGLRTLLGAGLGSDAPASMTTDQGQSAMGEPVSVNTVQDTVQTAESGVENATNGTAAVTEPAHSFPADVRASHTELTATTEVGNASNPGESSADPVGDTPIPEANTQVSGSSETPDSPRYLAQPYWSKPYSMTWAEWHLNGGNVPSWVSDMNSTTA